VPKQSWGHEEKSKGSKTSEHKKKNQYDDARPNEENKNKVKEPKPNTGGHYRPSWKDIPKTKGQETSTGDP